MSPILLYRENWVRIVLFISKPVDVVFAILFCFVQNKFVFCKAIVGFYFGIVKDDILAVIAFRKTICF